VLAAVNVIDDAERKLRQHVGIYELRIVGRYEAVPRIPHEGEPDVLGISENPECLSSPKT